MKAERVIRRRAKKRALRGLIINSLYGASQVALGVWTASRWFVTAGAYYMILSIMRFGVLSLGREEKSGNAKGNRFVNIFCGLMFFVLDAVLAVTVYLTATEDIGTEYHEIIMIAIAVYTFSKLSAAVFNFTACRKYNSSVLTVLRNISLADAAASVFSLQRSMLVSFGEMSAEKIQLFNILTGTGVFITVLLLAVSLLKRKKNLTV